MTPNFSMRMSNLAAALLRPQIGQLAERGRRWNHIYATLVRELTKTDLVSVPARNVKEEFIASSLQFSVNLKPLQIEKFLKECSFRGLYIKWFGAPSPVEFTSNYEHWHYLSSKPDIPHLKAVLDQLLDLRTPLSLTEEDCVLIGKIVATSSQLAITVT